MSKCCNDNGSFEAGPLTSDCGCNSIPCGCIKPSTCLGYKNVTLCQEDNTIKEYVYAILGSITSVQAFAMPQCGGTVTVEFDHICNVSIGTWLWAEGVGYLEVTASSNSGRTLTLKNICPSGYDDQAADGASVPLGTQFVLGLPQLLGSDITNVNSTLYPFLNAGFTAPASGDCIDITVTNVNGLAVGKNIAINTGTYRISAILSPTIITICNDGAGITAGQVVDYKDTLGNLLVPIVLIDSNPCTNPEATSGKVLVCDNDVIKPIRGSQNGQILTWDSVQQKANFRTLGIPTLECVELTANLILDPANPVGTNYLVYVTNTAAFALADIVLVGGTQLEITQILSGTTMRVEPLVHPTSIQNYLAGATLCAASCCDILDNRVDILEYRTNLNRIDALNPTVPLLTQSIDSVGSVPITNPTAISVTPATSLNGNTATITVGNPSGQREMDIAFLLNVQAIYDVKGAAGNYAQMKTFLEAGGNLGITPPAMATVYEHDRVYPVFGGTGVNRYSEILSWTLRANNVPPTGNFTASARLRTVVGNNNLSGLDVILLNVNITAFAVSVRI